MSVMNAKESPSMLRQRWLEAATSELRKYAMHAGFDLPAKLRISIGWAKGNAEKTLGQCWAVEASSDGHVEIFISPKMKDTTEIIATILHELVHAIAGHKAGHRGAFKSTALALGLEGKMTCTSAGAAVVDFAEAFIKKHGKYPAGTLSDARLKKQTTRLIKCECSTCGYIARVTAKWIDEAGTPHCGVKAHGHMNTDYEGSEEE